MTVNAVSAEVSVDSITPNSVDKGQSIPVIISGSGFHSGASVTLDGVSGVNGDLVLFTALTSGANRIYELSGVGAAIAWSVQRSFSSAFDPVDGDSVRIQKGDGFLILHLNDKPSA